MVLFICSARLSALRKLSYASMSLFCCFIVLGLSNRGKERNHMLLEAQ